MKLALYMARKNKTDGLGKRTAHVLSAVMVGQILNIFITGITIILIARLLGPVNYGVYVFAFGFASLIDAVGGFGIGTYFNRHLAIYSYANDRKKISTVLSSGYVLLFIVAAILTITALSLTGYVSHTLYRSLDIPETTLITASLMIAFVMLQAASVQALIGLSKGVYSSLSGIVGNSIQLFGGVSLILLGFGVEGALVGMLIGYIASSIIATSLVLRTVRRTTGFSFLKPKLNDLRGVARFAFPMGANNVLDDGMQNFSILFLGFFVSKAVLGNYGAALKGFSAAILLNNSINNVLLPAFSTAKFTRKSSSLHKTYNKVLIYSLMITLPILVYLMVYAKPAIYLFLSRSYLAAPNYMSLIMFGAIISTTSLFISALIVSRGKTATVLKYNLVATISELALVFLLTPSFTVYGNIFAIFIVGNTVSMLLMIHGAHKMLGMNFAHGRVFSVLLANLLLGAMIAAVLFSVGSVFAHSQGDVTMAIELLIGGISTLLIYPIILTRMRVISTSDIHGLEASVEQLPILGGIAMAALSYASYFVPHKR